MPEADARALTGPTIFLSAYRPPSVRYLVHSGVLAGMVANGATVVLFVDDPLVGHFREALELDGVVIEPIHHDAGLREIRGTRRIRFLITVRKSTSGRSRDLVNTTRALIRERFRETAPRTFFGRAQVEAALAVASVADHVPALRKGIVDLESKVNPGHLYDHYFDKYQPDLLVVSSLGYMLDPLFMRSAKRHGVPVASVIHNWDNTSTKDYRGAVPDHVVTWNRPMSREVETFHDIPASRIHEGGVAHWDSYFDGRRAPTARTETLAEWGLDPNKKTLFWGMGSPIAFSGTLDAVQGLLERIAAGDVQPAAQLVVRLHPEYLVAKKGAAAIDLVGAHVNDLQKRFPSLVKFIIPDVKRPEQAEGVSRTAINMTMRDFHGLVDSLHAADVLITEYSTLLLEGAIMGRPVINVGFVRFRDSDSPATKWESMTHLGRVLRTGACQTAATAEELIRLTNRYLAEPGCDAEERKALVAQEITSNPGSAVEAIARLVVGFARASHAKRPVPSSGNNNAGRGAGRDMPGGSH